MVIADKFQQCNPSVSNSYNSCGTITRTSLKSLTPAQLLTVFQDGSGNYRDMTSLLKNSFELKACGIKTHGLYDYLMSSAAQKGQAINKRNISGSESYIEPFIFGRTKSLINDDYWALDPTHPNFATGSYTTGQAAADGTGGPLASLPSGTTRVLRVFSRTGIDVANEWFVPNHKIHVFSLAGNGAAQKSQWKILASAADTTNQLIDLAVAEQDSGSSTPSNGTPTAGYVVIGTNDVSDYESWCNNRPALNPNKLVPFFFQTSRQALCVDSNYKEYLAKVMEVNPLFEVFGDVPLAERNRQVGERAQKEWVNSFFWGKALPNQTISTYTSLSAITSVSGVTMGYRANAVGVYEQLRACGRVTDWAGAQLKIRTLLTDIYRIVRARETSGIPNKSVDIYTDSETAELFKRGMIQYFNNQSGGLLRFNQPIEEGNIDGSMQDLGFYATSYKVDYPAGCVINIVTHPFYDDILSAAKGESIDSTGRFLWILDIGKGGSIYPGIIGSNRVSTTVDEIDLLRKVNTAYSCVMSNPTRDITLNSVTWTAIVECPAANLIYENFSSAVPDGVNA
jgi:hypothetical protein